MDKRNWRIYFEWIEGRSYGDLAKDYNLAESSVKEICKKLIPGWAKNNPYLTKDSYKMFKEWKRTHKRQPVSQRKTK